jgi:hypothetical protein
VNAILPGADKVWASAVAVGLVLMLAATGWLIDNALLPVLRPVLRPVRPWLERRHPAVGGHRKVTDEPRAAEHARPETVEGEGRALHGLNHAQPDVPRPAQGPSEPAQHGVPTGPGHPRAEWHPLDDDWDKDLTGLSAEDTDTLAVFREINAGHPVPTNEPQTPSGAGEPPADRTTAGQCDDPAPEGHLSAQQPSGESGGLGAQAAAHRPFRQPPAADDTIIDPGLLPQIRDALGYASVELYLDAMRRNLAPLEGAA